MHKYHTLTVSAVLALLLFLASAGCGDTDPQEQETSQSNTVVFRESEPVAGWLDVTLPGVPLAMDGSGGSVWILTDNGVAMGWDSDSGRWSSLEADDGFDIAVSDREIAILAPGGISILRDGEMTGYDFSESAVPVSVCGTDAGPAVLFQDGSVVIYTGNGAEDAVEAAGLEPAGGLLYENGVLAWMNRSGNASRNRAV